MRISIIGQAGSGKTTLAHKISEKLHIPHLQIDKLWFKSGGHKLKPGDVEGKEKIYESYIRVEVKNFVAQEAWVTDGFYGRVEPLIADRADVILFLDIPLWRRLYNHVRRMFFTERHSELTTWDDIRFIPEIIRRAYVYGPRVREFALQHASKVKVLRSYKEVDRYLKSLG